MMMIAMVTVVMAMTDGGDGDAVSLIFAKFMHF